MWLLTFLRHGWGCRLSTVLRFSWAAGWEPFSVVRWGSALPTFLISPLVLIVNLPLIQLGLLVVYLASFSALLSTFPRFNWGRWLLTFVPFPFALIVFTIPPSSTGCDGYRPCSVSTGRAGYRPFSVGAPCCRPFFVSSGAAKCRPTSVYNLALLVANPLSFSGGAPHC